MPAAALSLLGLTLTWAADPEVLRPRVPASSLVQISALFRPEFLIEIETIGHIAG